MSPTFLAPRLRIARLALSRSLNSIQAENGGVAPDKAVILSEALRRSIINRGLYGAESKDPRRCLLAVALGSFPAAKL
jgi:hypothetical protein